MKTTNPEIYKKLLSLESHCNRIKEKESFVFDDPLNILHFIKRFFKADDIPEEDITKLVGVVQVQDY